MYLIIFIKSNVVRKDMEERFFGFIELLFGLVKVFECLMGLLLFEEVVNVLKSLYFMFLLLLLIKFDK